MEFNLYFPTDIVSGVGCVRANAKKLGALGDRALIVTGSNAAIKSGALADVTAALDVAGVPYDIFSGVGANPLVSTAFAIGERARETGAAFLIGIGGGSVLDATRAAAVFTCNKFEQMNDVFTGPYTEVAPFALVGTTAGTGSEVDSFSVLTDDVTGAKRSLVNRLLYAKLTLCDYTYTRSMDLRLTVSTALDALCHALESWFNTTATETSVLFARRSVELVYPWLRRIADDDFDLDSDNLRRDLFFGSLWAGLAIGITGTGFPHPAGYLFTENMGLYHGVACALFEADFVDLSLAQLDDATLDRLFAIIGSPDDLFEVLEILTENDFTLSAAHCDAIGARVGAAANTPKTLGGYSGDAARKLARDLFLCEEQELPVEGAWLFGE